MKTAEEWVEQIRVSSLHTSDVNLVYHIKQIQLDAIKHGMEIAATHLKEKTELISKEYAAEEDEQWKRNIGFENQGVKRAMLWILDLAKNKTSI